MIHTVTVVYIYYTHVVCSVEETVAQLTKIFVHQGLEEQMRDTPINSQVLFSQMSSKATSVQLCMLRLLSTKTAHIIRLLII